MKIRALTNGNVIEVDDRAAEILIEGGIYAAAGTTPKPAKPAVPPKPASPAPTPIPKKPTKVAPLTTHDMPATPKKVP